MSDEPSNAELGRRLADLGRRLDRIEDLLVSRNELTLSLEHLKSQIKGVDDDLKSLSAEQVSKGAGKTQMYYNIAAQIIGGVVLAAIIAWVVGKGGH